MIKLFTVLFVVSVCSLSGISQAGPAVGGGVRSTGTKVSSEAVAGTDLKGFRARLQAATARHLDLLIDSNAKVVNLKGKGADGMTALAFYQMFELTGNQKYRAAALTLADRIVKDMRATKHGVLFIKEKDKADGDSIAGGGPPALGWYSSSAAYIFYKEGVRKDDIKYIASVIDSFPWNENGWWANTIDIETGVPKQPMTKAGAINKSAAMAMAAGMISTYVKAIDPEMSARLKAKADKCIYKQIIPAQEADGFWNYGFKGKGSKNKDVLGYFMVTTNALIQLQQLSGTYRDKDFQSALDKAYSFSLKNIAPVTEPNTGAVAASERKTAGTPARYDLADDAKRGFQLGTILFAGKNFSEGNKIMDSALKYFEFGNTGMDGAHAAQPSAMILAILKVTS